MSEKVNELKSGKVKDIKRTILFANKFMHVYLYSLWFFS
jgi:hypothetical protein